MFVCFLYVAFVWFLCLFVFFIIFACFLNCDFLKNVMCFLDFIRSFLFVWYFLGMYIMGFLIFNGMLHVFQFCSLCFLCFRVHDYGSFVAVSSRSWLFVFSFLQVHRPSKGHTAITAASLLPSLHACLHDLAVIQNIEHVACTAIYSIQTCKITIWAPASSSL